jgi:hypothetical protein
MAKTSGAKGSSKGSGKASGNPNPNPATRFTPGVSGNPGGKPVNARNALTASFLKALAADFEAHGAEAIESARTDDPVGYVRVVASLLPKEFVVERPLEGLSDDELAAAIGDIRARLRGLEAPGQQTTPETPEAAPASTLRH